MSRASNARRLAGICFSTALLFACATPPQTRELLADLPATSLPVAVELEHTPFHPQERYQCGPAALATVLGAHAVEVTPDELAETVFVPALQGSLPEEMDATARQYGLLAYPLRPSLTDLLSEVAHDNPVLVFLNLGTAGFPKWHFAVVVGYDLKTGEVILRSGKTRRWLTTLAALEKTWSGGGYWARVILPAGDIPASAQPDRYLLAAHDLEQSGQVSAATLAYQAATSHWPEEPAAWMAFGNRLYASEGFQHAESAYWKATRLEPADPRAWNNLAYALLRTGCPGQARKAATCAVDLAPAEYNYRETLDEINTLAIGADGQHCRSAACNASTREPEATN